MGPNRLLHPLKSPSSARSEADPVRHALLEASDALASGGPEAVAARRRPARWLRATVLACLLIGLPLVARAAPFLWDEDGDRIDDRIETIHLLGYTFAFENGDTLARMRVQVTRDLLYSVYVVYDHPPTNDDRAALTLLGMPTLFQYEAMPAIRSVATFIQVQAAASLSGVERVEAVPVLYPMLHDAAGAIGARDPSNHAFPTWYGSGGSDGSGIVIAFLDTGINDAPDGGYPGHESLLGRFLGGATFLTGDANFDTPKTGSVNPVDRGGAATLSHGTHVASIALGTGGPTGYARGIAPGARFVDIKALNDAGTGTGVAEALDWCISNRSRNWDVPGYEGIDVINLSLSSVDEADGNDLASRLASTPSSSAWWWSARSETTAARGTSRLRRRVTACSRWARTTTPIRRSCGTTASRASTTSARARATATGRRPTSRSPISSDRESRSWPRTAISRPTAASTGG
jgi:hypothetical protein